MKEVILIGLGVICVAAALGWARSARYRRRFLNNIGTEEERQQDPAYLLAQSAFRKEVHSTILYSLLAIAAFLSAASNNPDIPIVFALAAIPALVSVNWSRGAVREARLSRQRFFLEKRAEEALEQTTLRRRHGLPDLPLTRSPTSLVSMSAGPTKLVQGLWPATSSTSTASVTNVWPQ